jgi:hypothetical protein
MFSRLAAWEAPPYYPRPKTGRRLIGARHEDSDA